MDTKQKMKLRKSANTMTGLVISLLIVFGLFFGSWYFIIDQINTSGVALDSKYNNTILQNLTETQDDLDNNIKAIEDNLRNVTEAENTFQVAWNGLKGLGNTLRLPYNIMTTAFRMWYVLIPPLDIIPQWITNLVFIGITAFIAFLVLKILKGEPNM